MHILRFWIWCNIFHNWCNWYADDHILNMVQYFFTTAVIQICAGQWYIYFQMVFCFRGEIIWRWWWEWSQPRVGSIFLWKGLVKTNWHDQWNYMSGLDVRFHLTQKSNIIDVMKGSRYNVVYVITRFPMHINRWHQYSHCVHHWDYT